MVYCRTHIGGVRKRSDAGRSPAAEAGARGASGHTEAGQPDRHASGCRRSNGVRCERDRADGAEVQGAVGERRVHVEAWRASVCSGADQPASEC